LRSFWFKLAFEVEQTSNFVEMFSHWSYPFCAAARAIAS